MPTEFVQDGTGDFTGGQDAYHAPDRIQPNQIASGVNLTTNGGILSPRPAYHQIDLTFDNQTLLTTTFGYARSAKDVWSSGKFQALIPYPQPTDNYVITVISGRLFKTNLRTHQTVSMSDTLRVNQYSPRINWSIAEGIVAIHDYPDYPIIIDGSKIFRSDPNHLVNGQPAPQMPISVGSTYNQNRWFVYNAGVEFTAGDAVGNLATPEAPLTFTEVFTPSSPFYQQVFSLPVTTAMYPITAMGFLQQVDTSTGIGQLFVGTTKKVYTYQTAQPRGDWENSIFGTVLLDNVGIAGPRAFVNVNSDFMFLSGYGQLHALSTARNDQRQWGQVPISREVENYLKFTDLGLAQFAAMGYWQNRIFVTANPYRTTALDTNNQPVGDYAHAGFVVLELQSVSSLSASGSPSWPGLWTGVDPMDICNVGDECIMIGKFGMGRYSGNALYRLDTESNVDIIKGRRRQVQSIVYTREYDHQSSFDYKKEHTVALQLESLAGDFKLKIERKPSHSNAWLLYTEWTHKAPVTSCVMTMDELINGIDAQQLGKIVFGDAKEEGCNPITGDSYITYCQVQYRLTLTGDYWSLKGLKIQAVPEQVPEQQQQQLCNGELPVVRLPAQCIPDWNIPEVQCQE